MAAAARKRLVLDARSCDSKDKNNPLEILTASQKYVY
jgi:hypothetical protein